MRYPPTVLFLILPSSPATGRHCLDTSTSTMLVSLDVTTCLQGTAILTMHYDFYEPP